MPPRIEEAPGLKWVPLARGRWKALWRARFDIVAKGYTPKVARLWEGEEPNAVECARIADRCNSHQAQMLMWANGGAPAVPSKFDGTIGSLIECYLTDRDSPVHKLRWKSRVEYEYAFSRLSAHIPADQTGEPKTLATARLSDIKGRTLLAWHREWVGPKGHITLAHRLLAMLQVLAKFGATILDDEACQKLVVLKRAMRFPMYKPRTQMMTVDEIEAVIDELHRKGRHSMAFAQALQFGLALRQKDVIGEWVPMSETGMSDVVSGQHKWLRGLRWNEIDANLVLRHTTSKRGKDVEFDLKLEPLIARELDRWNGEFPAAGPVIVCETSGVPWDAGQYRKHWRAAARAVGIDDDKMNMDSRASALSEADLANADPRGIQALASHSNFSTTEIYLRANVKKADKVIRQRVASRGTNAKPDGAR